MIKFLLQQTNPQLLIITPLKKGDKVSTETYKSVGITNVASDWIIYEDNQNPYKNFDDALRLYLLTHNIPKYIIKMDNDIVVQETMLEQMVETLEGSQEMVAYTYCDFSFTGAVNMEFKANKFDINQLLQSNYISSISMMKSSHLKDIGGVVTDDKYFRLLDWALWLKFLLNGKVGEPTPNTSFVAYASSKSVSAGTPEDYKKKAQLVMEDFVVPIRIKYL